MSLALSATSARPTSVGSSSTLHSVSTAHAEASAMFFFSFVDQSYRAFCPSYPATLSSTTQAKFDRLDVLVSNAAVNPTYGPTLEVLREMTLCVLEARPSISTSNILSMSLAYSRPMRRHGTRSSRLTSRLPFCWQRRPCPTFVKRKGVCRILRESSGERERGAAPLTSPSSSCPRRNVLFVSSIAGYTPLSNLGPYSVSKTALLGLTKVIVRLTAWDAGTDVLSGAGLAHLKILHFSSQVLAGECGADGVRVNCLAPGIIETEFSRVVRRLAKDV